MRFRLVEKRSRIKSADDYYNKILNRRRITFEDSMSFKITKIRLLTPDEFSIIEELGRDHYCFYNLLSGKYWFDESGITGDSFPVYNDYCRTDSVYDLNEAHGVQPVIDVSFTSNEDYARFNANSTIDLFNLTWYCFYADNGHASLICPNKCIAVSIYSQTGDTNLQNSPIQDILDNWLKQILSVSVDVYSDKPIEDERKEETQDGQEQPVETADAAEPVAKRTRKHKASSVFKGVTLPNEEDIFGWNSTKSHCNLDGIVGPIINSSEEFWLASGKGRKLHNKGIKYSSGNVSSRTALAQDKCTIHPLIELNREDIQSGEFEVNGTFTFGGVEFIIINENWAFAKSGINNDSVYDYDDVKTTTYDWFKQAKVDWNATH